MKADWETSMNPLQAAVRTLVMYIALASPLAKSGYGAHLLSLLDDPVY